MNGLFLLMIALISVHVYSSEVALKRNRRYLLYSLHGSKLQLIFGTGIPIHVRDISATIGWVIKSAYLVPTNASIYTDPYGDLRTKRSKMRRNIHRNDLYRNFEKRILSFHSAGRDCLLKAICEASQKPFEKVGLVGQLLSVFFQPSTTNDHLSLDGSDEYLIAEKRGVAEHTNCNDHYPACDINLVDLFSIVT